MVDNLNENIAIEETIKKPKVSIKKIIAKLVIYLVLLLLYAPIIYITVYSFTDFKIMGIWNGFSLVNYTTLFDFAHNKNAQDIWNATLNTVLVAGLAGIISTILGTLGAIGIHNMKNKASRNIFNFINQIPVVNAEIVTAVSLCVMFVIIANVIGIKRNFGSLLIGHIVFTLPYVVMSVTPKLEQMDPALYEAALDLGATRSQGLRKVIIPEILPGILSGFMLSVTLSLDDYVITAFTKPANSGFNTISTYVDSKLAKGTIPVQLRAFTAILFAAILIVMIGMNIKASIDAKNNVDGKER